MSEALKGRTFSEEHKAKLRGYKHTEAAKQKIAAARIGAVVPSDTRRKISDTLRGKPLDAERKERMRQAALKRWARVRGEIQ
ncbi:NUMOD3 domain-containing DNA-binding protein [Pseudoroseomonas vastitatis]|uniref:Nuclease associated modular domain-containing protein n=2 Tax=Teichococcus vastitatis TaxID=2307076 RepID=A0ABS9WCQ3_9PROT|nr:hypothetical protein [Pseudoroseomonas vastitatis]